jgi:hypothetical protein
VDDRSCSPILRSGAPRTRTRLAITIDCCPLLLLPWLNRTSSCTSPPLVSQPHTRLRQSGTEDVGYTKRSSSNPSRDPRTTTCRTLFDSPAHHQKWLLRFANSAAHPRVTSRQRPTTLNDPLELIDFFDFCLPQQASTAIDSLAQVVRSVCWG